MPIDTTSQTWNDGQWIDNARIEINNLFREHPDKAFNLEEITSHLINNEPQVFPDSLLDDGKNAEYARQSFLASQLERLDWLNHVEIRHVDGDLYYAEGDDPRFPLPEIKHDVPEKIDEAKENIENETHELKQRLNRLENRFRQEVGRL